MPGLRPLQEYRAASWPVDGASSSSPPAWPWPSRCRGDGSGSCSRCARSACSARGGHPLRGRVQLLAGPLVAVASTELVARLARAVRWAPRGPDATVAVVAALAGLTLVPRLAAVRRGERAVDLSIEPDLIPLPAIRFADDNGLRERMYNDLEVGSYLIWQGWPAHRVFQDPRINGYPEAFHAVLRRDDLSRADWEAFLARFGVTTALVTFPDVNPRAALFAPERWALVYRDADALVFAARRPEFAALIARAEIPLTFGFARGAGVTAQPLPIRPNGSPVRDCDWQKRLGDLLLETGDEPGARAAYAAAGQASDCLAPASRQAAALARGDLALKSGDAAAAVEAYAGLTEPRARANRGLALMSLGRAREAEADSSATLAANPQQPEARLAQAFAFEALGRGSDAVASFRAFLALAPGHAAAARARAEIGRLGDRRRSRPPSDGSDGGRPRSARAERREQLGHALLGVAEQHERVVVVAKRVVDARVPGRHAALEHHDARRLPDLQHRHPVDRAAGIVLGRGVHDVVGADHHDHVGGRDPR